MRFVSLSLLLLVPLVGCQPGATATAVTAPAPGTVFTAKDRRIVIYPNPTPSLDVFITLMPGAKATYLEDNGFGYVLIDTGTAQYSSPSATATFPEGTAGQVIRKFRLRTRGGNAGSVGSNYQVQRGTNFVWVQSWSGDCAYLRLRDQQTFTLVNGASPRQIAD